MNGASPSSSSPKEPLLRPLPWLLVACLVVTTVWFAYAQVISRAETALGQRQRALTEIEAQSLRNQLEAERIIHQRQLADGFAHLQIALLEARNGTSARAIAAWDPTRQAGLLQVTGLPRLPAGERYRLWLMAASPAEPVAAGEFVIDAPEKASRVPFAPKKPVLTVERFVVSKGDERAPPRERDFILSGK